MDLTMHNTQNILCKKADIILTKINNNEYEIHLTSTNNNILFRNIVNFDIYKLLGEVNKKNIESCTMTNQISPDVAEFLFKFKALGLDFGIPKKYMYVKTKCNHISNNVMEYVSNSIDITDDLKVDVKGYEKITCHTSTLRIELINDKSVQVKYYFNIDIHEDLPIFAQNLLGFLMKNMFLNLKLFIENIQ